MKIFSIFLTFVAATIASTALAQPTGSYGIHLFFNETEFVDVLDLQVDETGNLTGHMHVPNDFDGNIQNAQITGKELRFDLFVPKNAARPKDLIFQYHGHFFDEDHAQLIGFVTLESGEFVAAFTGFRRSNSHSKERS